jgi:hypothetical protein
MISRKLAGTFLPLLPAAGASAEEGQRLCTLNCVGQALGDSLAALTVSCRWMVLYQWPTRAQWHTCLGSWYHRRSA